jgi:hypothetical protein
MNYAFHAIRKAPSSNSEFLAHCDKFYLQTQFHEANSMKSFKIFKKKEVGDELTNPLSFIVPSRAEDGSDGSISSHFSGIT